MKAQSLEDVELIHSKMLALVDSVYQLKYEGILARSSEENGLYGEKGFKWRVWRDKKWAVISISSKKYNDDSLKITLNKSNFWFNVDEIQKIEGEEIKAAIIEEIIGMKFKDYVLAVEKSDPIHLHLLSK